MTERGDIARVSATPPAPMRMAEKFLLNSRGSTAIEFAIVLGPFLLFVFGVFAIGLHYLATNSLERAVFTASRAVRTGIAQKANMTVDQFKQMVCSESAPHIDCNKLQVHVQNADNWNDIDPATCVSDGQLTSPGSGSDTIGSKAGGASKIVMVTACYDWDAAKSIPYFMKDKEGNARSPYTLASGGLLMQAAVVFRTEPYE